MDKLNRKISQKDLRRLMDERKLSQQKPDSKIVSPLAKYDSKGNLNCVICGSVIKSAALWKVHVNSKLHKHNVEEAKLLKEKLLNKTLLEQSKDLLKNKKSNTANLNKTPNVEGPQNLQKERTTSEQKDKQATAALDATETLPEMFFDDPVVDAKARNVEYKDAQDDEWEKFQREIKEESVASNTIIAGEQKNSAVEREIIEINEQIHHWSKVLDLEEKVEKLHKNAKRNNDLQIDDMDTDSSEEEEQNFNEYLDWRSKSFI